MIKIIFSILYANEITSTMLVAYFIIFAIKSSTYVNKIGAVIKY